MSEVQEFTVWEIALLFTAVDVLCSHLPPAMVRESLAEPTYEALQRARSLVVAERLPGGPPGAMRAKVLPFQVTSGGESR